LRPVKLNGNFKLTTYIILLTLVLRFRNIAMKTAYSNNIHNKFIVEKCVDFENKKNRLIFAEKIVLLYFWLTFLFQVRNKITSR
jgi:hypothetical protein